jgi:hypothetical protein
MLISAQNDPLVETWNFDGVGLPLPLNLPASHNLFKLCCFGIGFA